MQKTLFDKWILALESGEYTQGIGHLCKEDKYCCLGILADIASKEEDSGVKWVDNSNSFKYVISTNTGYSSAWSLSNLDEQFKSLKVRDKRKDNLTQTIEDNLLYMNDDGCKFVDIAEYIKSIESKLVDDNPTSKF